MDDHSSTQSFPSLNLHRHRPAFHLALPSLLSPETLYPSSQPILDSLEQYGSRGEDSTTSFPTLSTSSGERKGSSGADIGFLNTSGSNLDGDVSHLGHLDGNSRLGSHFAETWYGACKKEEVWEDGESCESAAGEFFGKGDYYRNANDVFYTADYSSEDGARRKIRANYNNYDQVGSDTKSETVFNREANDSRFTKQTTSCSRGAEGSFSDSSVDYCKTDSRMSGNYLGRDEKYRSSNGSGEDQLLTAEVEGPWLSSSPSIQTGEGRWRGAAGTHTLASGCLPQRSSVSISSGTYTQKLDSFSEAFFTQRKRRFPVIPSGDSSGQMWEFALGRGESHGLVNSRQSCAFDSDSYLPPSSSSPSHPSLLSFPSPPTASHLMSSVLSPPPTPLPPPSHSPSKMDSSSAFGATGHSVSQGGESLLPSRLQSLSVQNSGMIWKFPLLSHNFSQLSGEPSSSESDLISSRGDDYATTTAPHNIFQSPESSFITSSSHRSSLRALCLSNTPSLHPSVHLPSRPSHFSSQHYEEVEKIAPYLAIQKGKNGPANQKQAQLQQQFASVYNGTSFPSILHSSRGQKRHHYTPRPLLNPVRRGTGLYSSISYNHYREDETGCGEDQEECEALPYVNVGYEFQAELPPCFVDGEGSGGWSPGEESPREQLLWKPWDELEESADLREQVQTLLTMCSSSCLPGGGSNTELALHCLHYCQGNTMAALELLLFSQPLPTGDYHYSGSDFWTNIEKGVFGAALETYGKDFSVIQKTVRTKTTGQCVEFYYLSKKLVDKQKKLKEEENRNGELEQQKSVTTVIRQFGFEEAVPLPSLASCFPCKLCGKMFYKIKSRNAHMKIHRQPQEDWPDRRLQHQLLTQRLALSRSNNLIPTPGSNLLLSQTPALAFSSSGLTGTSGNNADNVLNSVPSSNTISPSNASVLDPSSAVAFSNTGASNTHIITSIDADDSGQRLPTTVLSLHQSWGTFEHSPDHAAYYCNTEVKDHVLAGTVGGKEPINWQ